MPGPLLGTGLYELQFLTLKNFDLWGMMQTHPNKTPLVRDASLSIMTLQGNMETLVQLELLFYPVPVTRLVIINYPKLLILLRFRGKEWVFGYGHFPQIEEDLTPCFFFKKRNQSFRLKSWSTNNSKIILHRYSFHELQTCIWIPLICQITWS